MYLVPQVGNLQPLFKQEYPKCWGAHEECSTTLLSSIHYTQACRQTPYMSRLQFPAAFSAAYAGAGVCRLGRGRPHTAKQHHST